MGFIHRLIVVEVVVSLLFSCVNNNETTDILTVLSTPRVESTYNSEGERISQLLINENGDTVHRIYYENTKIISSEGEYLVVNTRLDKRTKIVEFEVYSIDIDTLRRMVIIREFVDEETQYSKLLHFEPIDSSCYQFRYEFTNDTMDIMIGVEYGSDKTYVLGYTNPFILIFGNDASIRSKDISYLKAKNDG